jgi:acyl-homoserine lactone acylase PvdQ
MTAGRLSELIGERAIGVDRFFRTIGIRRSALEAWKASTTI